MLAKVLTGGGAKPLTPVQWPTVEGSEPDPLVPVTSSQEQLQGSEIMELRREVESLKSELDCLRSDVDRRSREAYEAGYRESEAAFRKTMEPKLEAELAKVRQVFREVVVSGAKLRHQAEEDLVRLAVAVARRILHREITVDGEAMVGLVKAAFARLDQREIHQVKTDLETLPLVQRIVAETGLSSSLKVFSDPALKRGSLVIETAQGSLDASVETQLQEIQRGFADFVAHS